MVLCSVELVTTVSTLLAVVATGVVDTGSGADSVLLGALADSITVTGALTSTSLNAGAGNDSFGHQGQHVCRFHCGGTGSDTLDFTAGSASIIATTIKGGAGADEISLYGGNDVVFNITHPAIRSLVERVQIPCCSPALF